MSGHIEIEKSGNTLTIQRSRRGRMMAALYRVVVWFPLILAGLAIFFSPDYFFRLAEEEPVPGLFWGSLVALALLVSFLAATMRFLRRESWIFDGSERTVVAEMRTLWIKPGRGEADLRDMEALIMKKRPWPKKSELRMQLDTGDQEVIFSAPGRGAEIEELAETIGDFLRDQRYPVDLVTDGGEE